LTLPTAPLLGGGRRVVKGADDCRNNPTSQHAKQSSAARARGGKAAGEAVEALGVHAWPFQRAM
jgi:hypothetical protein